MIENAHKRELEEAEAKVEEAKAKVEKAEAKTKVKIYYEEMRLSAEEIARKMDLPLNKIIEIVQIL